MQETNFHLSKIIWMNLNLNHLSTTFKLHWSTSIQNWHRSPREHCVFFPKTPRNNPKVARQSTKTPRHHQSGSGQVFFTKVRIKRWAPNTHPPTQTPVEIGLCWGTFHEATPKKYTNLVFFSKRKIRRI